MDLPVIKPRTTLSNKNEFNVNILKTAEVDVADMSLFPKTILHDVEESQFSEIRSRIDQLKQKL